MPIFSLFFQGQHCKIYPHGSEFPQSAFLVKRSSESLRCASPRVRSPFPMDEDLTSLLCLMLSSHHEPIAQ